MIIDTLSPPLLRVDRCPICSATHRRVLLGDMGDPVAIVRCNHCEMVYATGRYANTLTQEQPFCEAAHDPLPLELDRARKSLELYDELVEGRLATPPHWACALDIGCGAGVMLDELYRLGYSADGVEQVRTLATIAAARHQVFNIDVEDPKASLDRRYDLIVLRHVLEYLERPIEGLSFVERHLARGGVGVIEVRNWDDLVRSVWGLRYGPIERGELVCFFERVTLARAIQRAGLRLVALWSQPQGESLVLPTVSTALGRVRKVFRRRRLDSRHGRQGALFSVAWRMVLAALDRLDPVLARAGDGHAQWGANLVAVVARPRADQH